MKKGEETFWHFCTDVCITLFIPVVPFPLSQISRSSFWPHRLAWPPTLCCFCPSAKWQYVHCRYQRAFQEVNIPLNRALLPHCKIELTASLFLKKSLKKLSIWKKYFDKLVQPEMPGGIISKKKFFFIWSIFVSKIGYFFLKLPFSTTKWPAGLSGFGPKLPTGVKKNHVKDFCWCH